MKIRYLGCRRPNGELVGDSVGVGGFGSHLRGEVKDYPEDVGQELLATMRRQKFELVEDEAPKVTARKAGKAAVEEPVPAEGGTVEPAQEAPGGPGGGLEPGGGPAVEPAGEVPTAAGVGGQAPRKAKGKGKG